MWFGAEVVTYYISNRPGRSVLWRAGRSPGATEGLKNQTFLPALNPAPAPDSSIQAEFDAVWQLLPPQEQARMLDLIVQRVDYDGGKGTMATTFHPTGMQALAEELAAQTKEQTV